MIQCNRCNLQYIGETKRRLKDRFNEHRRTVDNSNNTSRPTTVSEHFLSNPNHTATDMQLIPIEKIFSSRDSLRKAREATIIIRAKTIDPNGLNARKTLTRYTLLVCPSSWFLCIFALPRNLLHCTRVYITAAQI